MWLGRPWNKILGDGKWLWMHNKTIHAYSFIKPLDHLKALKISQNVSGCVNELSQHGHESDIISESALNSAVQKLPHEPKNSWLTYLQTYDASYKNMRVFSAWFKNLARVQEKIRLQFGNASDKAKTSFTRDQPKNTSFPAMSYSGSPVKTECPLKNGEHKIWIGQFKANQTCCKDERIGRHNKILHRTTKKPKLWWNTTVLMRQPTILRQYWH